jgi:hypothetical protein
MTISLLLPPCLLPAFLKQRLTIEEIAAWVEVLSILEIPWVVMVLDRSTETMYVNARKTEAFDIFNLRYFTGPNPYLETTASVFNFALTGNVDAPPLEEYVAVIGEHYPHLQEESLRFLRALVCPHPSRSEQSGYGFAL